MTKPTKTGELLDAVPHDAEEMRWVDGVTDLLDTKFVIPGTKIRFGADFLLGLIPGVGDTISLGMSGVLIATMAKHGASGRLIARMLANLLIDSVVGSIPILGNLFDLFYKANVRNLRLMREYYEQDKHTGGAWPVVLAAVTVVLVLMGLVLWMVFRLMDWLLAAVAG